MTEFEKLRAGQYANTMDLSVLKPMARAYMLTRRFNRTSLFNQPKHPRLLKKLFASVDGEPFHVQSPIYVEYGKNIYIGKNFLANYNFVLQDGAPIHIGDNVLIASNVTITTILHSKVADKRAVQWVPQKFPKKNKGNIEDGELEQLAQQIASYKEKTPLRLYVDDVTTEKLTSVLADGGGKAAIVSSEGGIFDMLSGIYSKNVNIDVMLKGHSGDCIRVDRIGRNSESIMNPALTPNMRIILILKPFAANTCSTIQQR